MGDTLTVGPTEHYGANLALLSAGAIATASSGNADRPPSTDCRSATTRAGARAAGDPTPSLTVTLAGRPTINRIVVDTQSVGSTATGVRNYTRLGRRAVGAGPAVATVVGQYRTHELQLAFAPVAATAVRITVSEVDFGGYYGGGVPPWWSHPTAPPSSTPSRSTGAPTTPTRSTVPT